MTEWDLPIFFRNFKQLWLPDPVFPHHGKYILDAFDAKQDGPRAILFLEN